MEAYYNFAKTSWNSGTRPNGILGALVFLGLHSVAFKKIHHLEKHYPKLAKKDSWNQLQNKYKELDLNALIMMQAQSDARIVMNSTDPSYYFKERNFGTSFYFWYFHRNAAKNAMVQLIPNFIRNSEIDKSSLKSSWLSEWDAKDSLLTLLEQRLLFTELRYSLKVKEIAELLSLTPKTL